MLDASGAGSGSTPLPELAAGAAGEAGLAVPPTTAGLAGAADTSTGPLIESSTITRGVRGSAENVRLSVANGACGPAYPARLNCGPLFAGGGADGGLARASPATGFAVVEVMRPDALDECSEVMRPDPVDGCAVLTRPDALDEGGDPMRPDAFDDGAGLTRPDAFDDGAGLTRPDAFDDGAGLTRPDAFDDGAGPTPPDAVCTMLSSSALRSGEPGGGGGFVRPLARVGTGAEGGAAAAGVGDGTAAVGFGVAIDAGAGFGVWSGIAGTAGPFASSSSVQPDAKSAIRFFVSSPSRRRRRSSSGTGER